MAEKNNATCSICGKGYHVCLSCRDSINLTPWKKLCCSADCYKTFQVVKGFSTGVYTEEEFKSKLKNIDLSNLENYKDSIKTLIKNALKEDKPVAKAVKEIKEVDPIEPIDFVEVKTEAEAEVEVEVAEEMVVEKPVYSRKKNYKVEIE